MTIRKFLKYILLVLVFASFILGSTSQPGAAAPTSPVDESKVPHYFGPYPNYANSPQSVGDATVKIDGNGNGAEATATVGANGAITGITITNPGSNYTAATFTFGGSGNGASADAIVTLTGAVTAIAVDPLPLMTGYTAPVVTINGAGTLATATAFGELDSLTLDQLVGDPVLATYHIPTVAFDLPDDPNGTQPTAHVVCAELNCSNPNPDGTPGLVTITGIVLDTPGSGYSSAPGVAILDGTQFNPIRPGGAGATVKATLKVTSITVDTFGSGYAQATTTVAIADSLGSLGIPGTGTATVNSGAVTGFANLVGGSGYVTLGGLQKFVDGLPGLCDPDPLRAAAGPCPTDGSKAIPLGIADPAWTDGTLVNGVPKTFPDADTYEIGLVQYLMQFSSQLPPTLVRGYVQLETPGLLARGVSQSFPLVNVVRMPDGSYSSQLTGYFGVTAPQYLGPTIVATRDKAVRIVFRNLLPKGMDGDLFLPVDSTIVGSGIGPLADQTPPSDNSSVLDGVRNPMCTEGFMGGTMNAECFPQNRATLHLHGGVTPWISDGTPHQWITPAGEDTKYPQGVSVQNVPDMNVCGAADDGCQTFYYTNQQSARLMFYHDHAWGITRLNVYAGEAAGYLITDSTEAALMAGPLAGLGFGTPLVIQDKTFVSSNIAAQDPTWDTSKWGGVGSLWTPHVYMPAQNPGDPSGMSAYGRWMYGPWFWPPATDVPYQPILNPYYNMDPATNFTTPLAKPCNLDDPSTWQYQVAPFCEPQYIPGTPNVSVGMEAFNDTPVVNGTAYPTITLAPQAYRFRILNAANDRFWNLQWYVADATGTEVALNAAELAAAQSDPNIFPTPDTTNSPAGPSWIQIGTEGGFLPAPVVIPNQPITWITDPTRFDFGNVDQHALLLAPAERADVIVDFSQFPSGTTLILYNDAPAAFPARVASYDYYTGDPDLSPVGAHTTLPGYGPNTRTIMQVKIVGTQAQVFNLTALQNAFKHHADGSGVFEKGQHPIIVGQAAYNSAYGTSFAASSWCNAPGSTTLKCDGYARIQEQGGFQFGFNTLLGQNAKMTIPLQPKGIHDEMNSTSFDEYGRMQATIGLEAPGATPLLQNIILYPYVNPSSEIIDATNLPKGDINVTPISSGADGTQIWKITHNGVDTHPLHFHLYDVQILNRVTWDNIIMPPDANELGWKDTIRVSPLEDTIVALRPIIPTLPFEVPNSVRYINPMMPPHSIVGFNSTDANGNPTAPITNELTNFGWEYVWHCHILSHEEMDMMRPVSVAVPPNAPTIVSAVASGKGKNQIVTLTWTDNSTTETGFIVQRSLTGAGPWTVIATLNPNTVTYIDPIGTTKVGAYFYQVLAANNVGYSGTPGYSTLTVTSGSGILSVGVIPLPLNPPTNLTAVAQAGPQVLLTWTDNASNETGFVIERSVNGGAFATLITVGPRNGTGSVSYVDTSVTTSATGNTYVYRVAAVNAGTIGLVYSNTATVTLGVPPAAPSPVTATAARQGGNAARVTLTWTNVTGETGYRIQRATDAAFTANLVTSTVGANVTTFTTGNVARATPFYFRVQAFNGFGASIYVNATPFPITTP
jgi:FtsP/CotA-like multicopper oxidase with cupredoxin domain